MLKAIHERRKFERLNVPKKAGVYVTTAAGKKLGNLTVLGRGGFQVLTKNKFKMAETHELIIVDESEEIHRYVTATVRSVEGKKVGFEFDDLGPDAAVEMGIIIGKYYTEGNDD